MNAAVCVMVTVPTEQEERRRLQLQAKRFRASCWQMDTASCGQLEPELEPQLEAQVERSPNSRVVLLEGLRRNTPLEQVMRRIALQLQLEPVFWSQDLAGRQLQARFDLQQDERYERLLCTLQDWGIGDRPGTHVTAVNCMDTRFKGETNAVADESEVKTNEGQRLGWQSFMDSVRCRLNVNQVVRVVRRDATINFDFVVLLMAAALLSCVGLVENSFLFLSSSMLISPLMGPIIATIFGSVIGDHGLRWLGIRNELIGIAISVLTGFLFGCAVCLCGLGRFFVLSGGFTEEIVSRCDIHALAIGVCTALASGAAAAIGILGGNTGSLVGVAISASLLPPAVNAGLLWAIALCAQTLHLDAELLKSLSQRRTYSPQLHVELFWCGAVSMALTLLNIVCVWLMGVLVLRIKEVAPAVQRDEQFWRHDVRLAREVALRDPQLHNAIDRLDTDERRQVDLEAPQYQHTWSPGMQRPQQAAEAQTKDVVTDYHTVHGFQNFCLTLHKLKSALPRVSMAPTATPLPRFMDVFSSSNPAASCSTAKEPHGSNYCSLPDLRLSLDSFATTSASAQAKEARSKPRISRSVHWRQEYLSEQQQQHLQGGNLVQKAQRNLGQVLLPLPPDRSLELVSSRRSKNNHSSSEESDYEHEFNV